MSTQCWGDAEHRQFLQLLATGMGATRYLELGTYQGGTIAAVAACLPPHGLAVGVDDRHAGVPGTTHYQMQTSEFLARHAATHAPYDLVFIDADHQYAAVAHDFFGVLPLVRDQGVIVLHDTYPPDQAHTAVGYCADAWKFAVELRARSREPAPSDAIQVEVCTLPIVPGYTIIRRCAAQVPWLPAGW